MVIKRPTQKEALKWVHDRIREARHAGLREVPIFFYACSQGWIDAVEKALPHLSDKRYRVTKSQELPNDFGETHGPDYTISW